MAVKQACNFKLIINNNKILFFFMFLCRNNNGKANYKIQIQVFFFKKLNEERAPFR